MAINRNSLIGGDDFKSGQTKIKSVLVDFLVGAGIKVHSYFNSLVVKKKICKQILTDWQLIGIYVQI